ncbi:uncharacterized protein LOC141630465 [Silene latifolia]|uniref:uncharacterized protein LOC141630465 n=1 Tax=Silene latifolia TaxID=37657 RepID=UPI003D785726
MGSGRSPKWLPFLTIWRASRTVAKVLPLGFYWPTMFEDASGYMLRCHNWQRTGNISWRNEMPQSGILEAEVFDVLGIDFQGSFISSYDNKYIRLAVDYVLKWVEAIASPTDYAKVVTNLLKKMRFQRFGVPRALISDGGTHFHDKKLSALLTKYGVQHRTGL